MTVYDLSADRALVESYMVDRCKVLRDPEGTTDDELDDVTLEYPANPGDETTVYGDPDGGPCLLGRFVRRESRTDEGGQRVYRRLHRIRFPFDAPPFVVRDVVLMVTSPDVASSPRLVGQRFRVVEDDDRSLAASRIVLVEDEEGARVR